MQTSTTPSAGRSHPSQWIGIRSPECREVLERVKVATRLSAKLSAHCMDEPEPIRAAFEELIGKPVGDRFTLIPPFYADYGLNITVGEAVFIGYESAFTGYAPIDIADEVMIAHKVNLITGGHPVEPDQRRDYLTSAPITIERNVWIGAAATVLPGVRHRGRRRRRGGRRSDAGRPPCDARGRRSRDGRQESVTPDGGFSPSGARYGSRPFCGLSP